MEARAERAVCVRTDKVEVLTRKLNSGHPLFTRARRQRRNSCYPPITVRRAQAATPVIRIFSPYILAAKHPALCHNY